MQTAGMDGRRRATPARRRAFVVLAAALVLSSPFAARAEASDGSSGAAADQPTETTLGPVDSQATTTSSSGTKAADLPCVMTTTSSPAGSGSTTDGTGPSTTTVPACDGESDAGGTPRSANDDCADTGGSPTGAPRPCPALPQGSPDGPDDRLADCAGDIFQPSCADLARALEVQCASAWTTWCGNTAPGMLTICADGDLWSTAPCERARPVLVRYCSEVPDADPDRCPAIRPADAGTNDASSPTAAGAGGGTPTGGGAAGPRPSGEADGGAGGPSRNSGSISPAGGPIDRQVIAPLDPSPAADAAPKVVKKADSPTIGGVSIEASADPLTVGSSTIPPALGVEASTGPGGVGMHRSAGEDVVEAFAPRAATADLAAPAAVHQARRGEARSEASPQRSHDRWSLVSLGGALLLVMVTSAYDLRGRRRW
jgi:hypothetical protein